MNCHMPHTTYGLRKAIRSHQISSPSVATTIATGRPDACAQCHLDRPLSWIAQHLNAWYEQPIPQLPDAHQTTASAIVWLLSGDAAQRALVAWTMGWAAAQTASGSDWQAPFLSALVKDPYAAVRSLARRSLATLPGFTRIQIDWLAEPARRDADAAQVWKAWHGANPKATRRRDPALLIASDGGRDLDRLRALLDARDHRDVSLAE
jgi:hypothetical protein